MKNRSNDELRLFLVLSAAVWILISVITGEKVIDISPSNSKIRSSWKEPHASDTVVKKIQVWPDSL